MSESRSFVIDADKEKVNAQDFAFLRQQGIALIQALCRDTWTDHNLHDPGITILEQLCFAITDLAYRTDFPITDILCDETGNIRPDDNCFFEKEAILSINPVTINDFRKVLIDDVDELYNAWLEPVLSAWAQDGINGLYRLTIQVKKEMAGRLMKDAAYEQILKQKAIRSFVSKRNLCEDIVHEVIVLKPIAIRVRADVIINDDIRPEVVLAAIYRELEFAINPPARYFTEEEMLKKGFRTEEIYAGPVLKNGFIPDEELQPRNREIDPAELIKAITKIQGVVYVKSLMVVAPDLTTSKLPYVLKELAFAWFDDDLSASPVHLFKNKYQVHIQEAVFRDIRVQVQEAAKRSFVPALKQLPATGKLKGTFHDVAWYHSIQHLFPVIYGIGEEGLPVQSSDARKAQAKQLKAYLLFFEQVLAGYLAQLANTRTLFSPNLDHHPAQTYFYQPLYQVPGVPELLKAFTSQYPNAAKDDWNKFTKEANEYVIALGKTAETDETYRIRKNQFLDHLLARFNEQVVSYPVTLYQLLYDGELQERTDRVIQWKANLLRNIAALGCNRVRAFDYLQKEDGRISGFGKRVAELLYIRNYPSQSLAAVFRPGEIEMMQGEKYANSSSGSGNTAAVISDKKEWRTMSSAEYMQQLLTEDKMEPETAERKVDTFHFGWQKISFFKYGIDAANYTIGPDVRSGQGYLLLFKEPAAVKWHIISRHPDETAALNALKKLVAYLKNLSQRSEGFYLVEHILLRPLIHTPSFGFRFYGPDNEIVLQHDRWTSFDERNQLITAIVQAAGSEEQSSIKALSNLCRVRLQKDRSTGLFVNPAWLSDVETAEAAGDFESLRHYIQLFNNKKYRYLPRFELLTKDSRGNIMTESFFGFAITVVLPSWPARFQDNNFRVLLEDMFRINAPAHIKICFQWLNLSGMSEFEQLHTDWLTALQHHDDVANRETYAGKMMEFLRKKSEV
jgi:hypothetical protein